MLTVRMNLMLVFLLVGFVGHVHASNADCSAGAISAMALQAHKEQADGRGYLWGTEICTEATRNGNHKCFNACARVVSTILKKAGCAVSITSDAHGLWNQVKTLGPQGNRKFKPSTSQSAGCVMGLNSRKAGKSARLTIPTVSGPNVAFRHVAIAVGRIAYVDNYSLTSVPNIDYNSFFDWTKYADDFQYESPVFLCPAQ